MMESWALCKRKAPPYHLPPYRGSPGGGMVQNIVSVCGLTALVTLPDRTSEQRRTVEVLIDKPDLAAMDAATDGFWRFDAPGHSPRGVYLPEHQNQVVALVRYLLHAAPGMCSVYRDGDPLNCRRSNISVAPHAPTQASWLWSVPPPAGFTEVSRAENCITLRAAPGADLHPVWQYLLERWQFIHSRDVTLTVPRIHEQRTSTRQRITAIVVMGTQCVSLDMGDDGVRENARYAVRDCAEVA